VTLRLSALAAVSFSLLGFLAPALARADEEPPPPEPVGKLTPPPGWEADIGRSRGLEEAVAREDHFGGVPIHVSAQHLRAPQPGGILLTQEIATATLPSNAAEAASVEIHAVRSNLDGLGDTVKVARWDVRPNPAEKVAEGMLEWSDASLGTTTISRTLVFQTGGHLVRLTAECIIAADAGALRAPCESALSTLAPLAPVSARDALEVSTTPPVVAAAEPPRPEGEIPKSSGPSIGERDASLPVTIVVDAPKKKKDRRPFYVGGGLIVIVAAYMLNRRNRQRIEAKVADPKAADPKAGDPKAGDEEEKS
jgi:hypothetical protein